MTDHNTEQFIRDKVRQLSKYWHKRSLTNWEVTNDARTRFHIQIKHWGTHDAFLVFKDKIGRQEAEKVVSPVIEKISQANEADQNASLMVNLDPVVRVLDMERTKQANA